MGTNVLRKGLVIGIILLFIGVSIFPNINAGYSINEKIIQKENKNEDNIQFQLGWAIVSTGETCGAYAQNIVTPDVKVYAGDWVASVRVNHYRPGDGKRYAGVYQVTIQASQGPYINKHGSFDYSNLDKPNDIEISDTGYIPEGKHTVIIYGYIKYDVYYWIGNKWVYQYTEECEDKFQEIITFPCTKTVFNNQIQSMFSRFPSLFSILRMLLQRPR